VSIDANQVMTFQIKKKINTELFIIRMAALYILDGVIKNVMFPYALAHSSPFLLLYRKVKIIEMT